MNYSVKLYYYFTYRLQEYKTVNKIISASSFCTLRMIYLRKFIEEKLINKKKNFFNKYTFMGLFKTQYYYNYY